MQRRPGRLRNGFTKTTTPKIKQVAFGFTLKLKAGIEADKWYEQPYKQTIVRTADTREQKVISVECAYLIKNAIA